MLTPIIDHQDIPWEPHPRYPSVEFKALVKGADNTFVSVGLVRFPPGGIIGIHIHPNEIETIYGLVGEGVFTLQDEEMPFSAGQIVSVPIGMEHGLRNESDDDLEILTIFTPPLF
jgi:quercetin dioxygenase-like cupin family protein